MKCEEDSFHEGLKITIQPKIKTASLTILKKLLKKPHRNSASAEIWSWIFTLILDYFCWQSHCKTKLQHKNIAC